MTKNTRFDDIDFSSSKRFCRSVTCLFDLPDEILLLICRYLSPSCVLYSFFTPSKPEFRLHRVISDYYTKIKFDGLTNDEYNYLLNLFSCSNIPLHIQSLILSNEHITCLTQRHFPNVNMNIIQSMFFNLKSLKLIDCTERDLSYIHGYHIHFKQLENLYIRMHKDHEEKNMNYSSISNLSINQLLFDKIFRSIKSIFMEIKRGLILNKSLPTHQNLRNVDLILQTIDDLYILLDGLIPNVQTMFIQLCRKRILCYKSHPKMTTSCLQLTHFTLIDSHADIFMNNIKFIFGFMPNLNKLTLSIHDTLDSTFCHGPNFESILNEFLPYLRRFDYTMTHRIINQELFQDFIRWPMTNIFYGNENYQWIHIYSLPWPSSKDDKRRLPVDRTGSNAVTSDVKIVHYMKHVIITKSEEFYQLKTEFIRAHQLTTCLSIDIQLPLRIYKLILSERTPVDSFESIVQPSIRHLIIKCRLTDIDQLLKLARQFPHVNYLELLFSLNESLLIQYLKNMFSFTDRTEKNYKFWSELIHFTNYFSYSEFDGIWDNKTFYNWLIENTDLKYHKYPFHAQFSPPLMAIWF